jgi:hypothetical protein
MITTAPTGTTTTAAADTVASTVGLGTVHSFPVARGGRRDLPHADVELVEEYIEVVLRPSAVQDCGRLVGADDVLELKREKIHRGGDDGDGV